MSHWNYRVIKKFDEKTDTTLFQIHEVYYDDKNIIKAWTQSSVGPSGETMLELKEDIKYFMEALQKPTLQENILADKEILVEVQDPEN